MDKKNDIDMVISDAMPPGFRFHPSDEELVGFYLKRKVQQRPFPFELIKQADIYKYDPWDLPKLGGMGEKEWFFYCPRDRKYPNSMRPNRATGTGFWKATGTDRPIYSSHSNKCIGLKKSLVFYKGRAARGIKTDWMMYEFRLPSLLSSLALPPKNPLDKNLPLNDSWTICKIFNKANPKTQRAISQSNELSQLCSPEDIYCTTESIPPPISAAGFSAPLDFPTYCKPIYPTTPCTHHRPTFQLTLPNGELPGGDAGGVCSFFSPQELFINGLSDEDVRAIPFRAESEGPRQQFYGSPSINLLQQMMQGNMGKAEEDMMRKLNNPVANPSSSDCNHWENVGYVGLPLGLPSINEPSLPWDSSPSLGEDFH